MRDRQEYVTVPTGVARYPKEILRYPRPWVERRYNVTRWVDMPKGGHFAAMEQPELFAADVREFFDLGYRGARYSLGYGACPNLDDRVKIVDLLQPDRIGVTLSEELQLHPEQSTDALIVHHPEAKYFNAR